MRRRVLAHRQRHFKSADVTVVQVRAQVAGGVRGGLVLLARMPVQPIPQEHVERAQCRRASAEDRRGRHRMIDLAFRDHRVDAPEVDPGVQTIAALRARNA